MCHRLVSGITCMTAMLPILTGQQQPCPAVKTPPGWSTPRPPTKIPEIALRLDQIIVPDSAIVSDSLNVRWKANDSSPNEKSHFCYEYLRASWNPRETWAKSCNLLFDRYVTFEEFVGGDIREIRVVRARARFADWVRAHARFAPPQNIAN